MTDKIEYPFIPVPKDLIEADLPLAEFKLVVFLIGNQILDEKTGLVSCFYGIPEIANKVGTSQAAVRRSLYSLQNKKVVIIERKAHKLKKSGQFTNGVRVDFSAIGGLPKIGEKMNQGDTSLAEKMNQSDSKMNQGDSKMNQGDSSHKESRFKNIYLKNIYTEINQGDSSYIVTGDAAPVRSMPKPDKSGGDQQGSASGELMLDIVDLELVDNLAQNIDPNVYIWLDVVNINGNYIIRPISDSMTAKKIFSENKNMIVSAAMNSGRKIDIYDRCYHYSGEIIISKIYQQSKKGA